jgi:hypothetical protein
MMFLAAVAIAGCSDQSPTDELSAAQRRWNAWGPASYDLTVGRSCECTPEMAGPVVVRVRNGVVESKTYVGTGAPVDEFRFPAIFPDVPGLFQLVLNEIGKGHVTDVDYDATTGYPLRIMLDFDGPVTNGADGESSYFMTLRVP